MNLRIKRVCKNVTSSDKNKKKKKKHEQNKKQKEMRFITVPVPWQLLLLLLLLVVPFWRPSEIWRCCEKAPEAVYSNTAGYKTVSRKGHNYSSLLASRTFVNISYCSLALFTRRSISLAKSARFLDLLCDK